MNRSSVAGNKRKLSAAQLQAAANNNIYQLFCGNGDPSNEKDLDTVIESVNSGINVELLKRAESLSRARQKKCNAALRHKQMQLRTVQILYEYEVEDANSLYMRAFADLQEKLVKELTVVKTRIQACRRRTMGAQHYLNDDHHTNGNSKHSEESKQHTSDLQPFAGRSLRSTGIVGLTDTHDAPSNGSSKEHSNSGSYGGSSSSNSSSKRTLDIDQIILSERSIRSDFLTIVRDMNTRAVSASAAPAPRGGSFCETTTGQAPPLQGTLPSTNDVEDDRNNGCRSGHTCSLLFTPIVIHEDLASFTVTTASPPPLSDTNSVNGLGDGTSPPMSQKYMLGDAVVVSSVWATAQQGLYPNDTGDGSNAWVGTILCISHSGFILGVQDSRKRFSFLFGQIQNCSMKLMLHDPTAGKRAAWTMGAEPAMKAMQNGTNQSIAWPSSGAGMVTMAMAAGVNDNTTVEDDEEVPPCASSSYALSYDGSSSSSSRNYDEADYAGLTDTHDANGLASFSADSTEMDLQKVDRSPSQVRPSSLEDVDMTDVIALASLGCTPDRKNDPDNEP